MLPNANSQMTVQVGIQAIAAGTWDLPGLVTFSEATFTGGSVGMNVAAGSTVRCVGPVATDNFGSFVTKTGQGTLEFAGNQPISDPLIRLDLTAGSFRSSSSTPTLIPRLHGGTLRGTGNVGNVSTISSGTVAPGASPGVLNTKNLVWNSSTTYEMEIAGAAPGSGHDQLSVTGTVQLGGAALAAVRLGGFVPTVGQSFVIINNDASDSISGTFAGLAEDSALNVSGHPFAISYVGGDGNDVTLTAAAAVSSVPIASNVVIIPAGSSGGSSDATFSASITGTPNATVRLEASSDLQQWFLIASTTLNGNGAGSFINASDVGTAGNPEAKKRRFYRLSQAVP